MKIFFALLMTLTAMSQAAEVALNTSEINQLLAGNTIKGIHYQKTTMQYFSKSGLTLWISEGDDKPWEGQWTVKNNQYCSDFGEGWNCYNIVNDEKQGIYYFIGDDFRAPFILKQGYQFQF